MAEDSRATLVASARRPSFGWTGAQSLKRMGVTQQSIVTLDLEGVLVPEIWIAVAERTGIEALRRTTRDEPDYDVLMRGRLELLDRHGLKLSTIQEVIGGLTPLEGAKEFLDELRSETQVIILSDTFEEFAKPLMRQLGWPTLLCHRLIVENDVVRGYQLRQPNQKQHAVAALRSLNYRVIAAGDSFNDTAMLAEAEVGFLFHAPEAIVAQFPQFPSLSIMPGCSPRSVPRESRRVGFQPTSGVWPFGGEAPPKRGTRATAVSGRVGVSPAESGVPPDSRGVSPQWQRTPTKDHRGGDAPCVARDARHGGRDAPPYPRTMAGLAPAQTPWNFRKWPNSRGRLPADAACDAAFHLDSARNLPVHWGRDPSLVLSLVADRPGHRAGRAGIALGLSAGAAAPRA